MSEELWRWDTVKLAHAIRTRLVSSREAVAACLARLASVNPAVNAVVETLSEEALELAERADLELARGSPVGALHGVPVTTKINTDQKGCATTNGVAAFASLVAVEDSPSIANLRRAGAIVIGRTNAPEFSWRWFTDNELYGETVNPWNRQRTCGGSSGGAAAACDHGRSADHGAIHGRPWSARPACGRPPTGARRNGGLRCA